MKTNVIIGAGAAGLMAAAESAKRNINTILIEKCLAVHQRCV